MTTLKTTVQGRFVGGGLFEPRKADEDKTAKYSACIVLDTDEDVEKIRTIVKNAIAEKWGNKKPAGLTDWGVREGDDPEFEASFEKHFINPKSNEKKKPQTIIRRQGKIIEVGEDVIYPGCYVAVSVSAYCLDADKQKNMKACVCLNLRAVMFLADGERLGDTVDTDSEFEGFDSSESSLDDYDDILGEVA